MICNIILLCVLVSKYVCVCVSIYRLFVSIKKYLQMSFNNTDEKKILILKNPQTFLQHRLQIPDNLHGIK